MYPESRIVASFSGVKERQGMSVQYYEIQAGQVSTIRTNGTFSTFQILDYLFPNLVGSKELKEKRSQRGNVQLGGNKLKLTIFGTPSLIVYAFSQLGQTMNPSCT